MRVGEHCGRSLPAVLVVVGASGAGKTTLVARLASLGLPEVGCYYFDAIGVPPEEEIVARFGSGWRIRTGGSISGSRES